MILMVDDKWNIFEDSFWNYKLAFNIPDQCVIKMS